MRNDQWVAPGGVSSKVSGMVSAIPSSPNPPLRRLLARAAALCTCAPISEVQQRPSVVGQNTCKTLAPLSILGRFSSNAGYPDLRSVSLQKRVANH